MVPLQRAQDFLLRLLAGAAPQLRQNNGRHSDETSHRLDLVLVASGAQMIDKDGSVEDDLYIPVKRASPRNDSQTGGSVSRY